MNYYRKPINKTVDDVKLKMQIGTLTVKITENIYKINDLLEVDKDIKNDVSDNSNSIKNIKNEIGLELSDKVDQKYINDNFYNKDYIDDNYYLKRVLNNSFASIYARIDSKDNEVLNKIENNYYNKNELNNNFNNLYNRTYLDNKFDSIYDKNDLYTKEFLDNKFDEVNNLNSKLNGNIILFNDNLVKFIDETYKKDISNLKITDNEKSNLEQLSNIDLNKINTSYNFSSYNKVKLDKMRYYISF